MKVLHIGKKGNMELYSAPDSFFYQVETADAYMGLPAEEYLALAADADFIIVDAVGAVPIELMDGMPRLKLIHSEGVAYNSIDIQAAKERGIYVCNCQGANAMAVAEQAILLMLGMLRDVAANDRVVREARQISVKEGYMQRGDLLELADCAVGLVGFGSIARSTAKLLLAHGVEHIYYNKRSPLSPQEEEQLGVQYLPLEALLQSSDIVSLHLPVNLNTIGIADSGFFQAMRDGSYFVNTARGELVDDDALIEALSSGKLRMAGLDTLDNEPVRPDHPLIQLPEDLAKKILFSPHIGGITAASFRRSYAMIWEDIQAVAEGRIPQRVVNP